MTDKVNPSINRPATAFETAGAIAYGGHGDDGYIVDGSTPISDQDARISEGNFNKFDQSSGGGSLDVDIDAGEAFIFGSWLAIDTQTTVSLAASTNNQTVYIGWNKNDTNDVIIGLDSAFSSSSGDTDKKIPLWEFDTDGTGVTNVTDKREIGVTKTIDGKQYYGPNKDFYIAYNSGTNKLELVDNINDTIKQTWDKSGDSFFPNGKLHAESNIIVEDNSSNTLLETTDGGPVSMTDADTDTIQNKDYSEAVTTHSKVSGTVTIDISTSNYHVITTTGNIDIEYSNFSGSPPGNSLLLYFEDGDGSGPHTIDWTSSQPAGVSNIYWPGNGTDSADAVPGSSNIRVSASSPDGGSTWRQTIVGEDFG